VYVARPYHDSRRHPQGPHPQRRRAATLVMLGEYQRMSVDCFPSQDMLAAPLGVKVRQLQTFCKELENYTRGDPPEPFPLIEVKRAGVGKERKTRNFYNLQSA
jgi:hypothetical protein